MSPSYLPAFLNKDTTKETLCVSRPFFPPFLILFLCCFVSFALSTCVSHCFSLSSLLPPPPLPNTSSLNIHKSKRHEDSLVSSSALSFSSCLYVALDVIVQRPAVLGCGLYNVRAALCQLTCMLYLCIYLVARAVVAKVMHA